MAKWLHRIGRKYAHSEACGWVMTWTPNVRRERKITRRMIARCGEEMAPLAAWMQRDLDAVDKRKRRSA